MASDSCTSATSFIGCKLSLISFSGIRYEGTLHSLDNQTAVLSAVRSLGTETRRVKDPVEPKDMIHDFIVFRGTDIKEFVVHGQDVFSNVFSNVSEQESGDPAIILEISKSSLSGSRMFVNHTTGSISPTQKNNKPKIKAGSLRLSVKTKTQVASRPTKSLVVTASRSTKGVAASRPIPDARNILERSSYEFYPPVATGNKRTTRERVFEEDGRFEVPVASEEGTEYADASDQGKNKKSAKGSKSLETRIRRSKRIVTAVAYAE